jgi:hypothetical protein
MLDSMRRHANSWVFSLLFAVIIFVFAVNFGPWAGRVAPVTLFAVEVNGRAVSMLEFETLYNEQFAQEQMQNPGLTRETAEKMGLSKHILDILVQRELLAQLAEANNLAITDEELAKTISQMIAPAGQPITEEERKAYEKNVQEQYHISAGEFEARIRRQMLASRMAELLYAGVPVSESDLKTNFVLWHDQVAIDFIRIDPEHFQGADKDQKVEEAKKYATSIIEELKTGKKLDHIARADLTKKEKGAEPSAKDVAPVFGTTELFSRNQEKIPGFGFASPEVVSAAFGLQSPSNEITNTPILSNGKLYILALKERKAPDMAQFDKDKDQLRLLLVNSRASEFYQEFIAHLKDKSKDRIVYNEAILRGQNPDLPPEA